MGYVAAASINSSAYWTDEPNASDLNTKTYATNGTFNNYLTLNRSMWCDKIRVWLDEAGSDGQCTIDVLYGGAWHEIWSKASDGDITKLTWVEINVNGGATEYITSVRIKSTNKFQVLDLYELEFNEGAEPAGTRPRVNCSLVNAG